MHAELDVNRNNQYTIEQNEMEVDIEDNEDHIDRFEVIDNQQVANDNSASDYQIRQAISDVYNNNEIEENKEPESIDANNTSNYARTIGQERYQNQLEMEALEQRIKAERQEEQQNRRERSQHFREDQLIMKNAFVNTVHIINHAQRCIDVRNYVEAKEFLDMAIEKTMITHMLLCINKLLL